jgi:hypothetical protein
VLALDRQAVTEDVEQPVHLAALLQELRVPLWLQDLTVLRTRSRDGVRTWALERPVS